MQQYFNDLADFTKRQLAAGEEFTSSFSGEDTDFSRLNNGRIRQSGSVHQAQLVLNLIKDERSMTVRLMLSGDGDEARRQIQAAVSDFRAQVAYLPKDPYLFFARDLNNSELIGPNKLPDSQKTVAEITARANGYDLVGIYAAGGIYRGFANSLGQRNWFANHSFNFDWSIYHDKDKAVKGRYAGFHWDQAAFQTKFEECKKYLAVLKRPAKRLSPGQFRAFLAPMAVNEIIETMGWNCFGLKSLKTKQSPLMKMFDEGVGVSEKFSLCENTAEGSAPNFDGHGFIKPPRVPLIAAGKMVSGLVSARSAREYGVAPMGAASDESPEAYDLAAGELNSSDILSELGTGVLVNNLWYLNYSDRNACRITGMTRFATLWVEDGEVVAPIDVMRFDESVYELFGSSLLGLTRERDFLMAANSYSQRYTSSSRLPGVLLKALKFTL